MKIVEKWAFLYIYIYKKKFYLFYVSYSFNQVKLLFKKLSKIKLINILKNFQHSKISILIINNIYILCSYDRAYRLTESNFFNNHSICRGEKCRITLSWLTYAILEMVIRAFTLRAYLLPTSIISDVPTERTKLCSNRSDAHLSAELRVPSPDDYDYSK